MANNTIKFGTSGWRARIADDFNVSNIRRVAHATALHIKENREFGFKGEEYRLHLEKKRTADSKTPLIVIGYDTRFYSEQAAGIVAEVFAFHGIASLLSHCEAPTPTIAWLVMKNNAIGGVTITASHNPPNYNGYKWTPFWGGPAIPEITNDIELRSLSVTNIMLGKYVKFDEAVSSNLIKIADFHKDYMDQIHKLIDLAALKKFKIKVAADSVNGTARTYLRPILEKAGVSVIGLREERDVYFGGHSPDTDAENLGLLRETVLKNRLDLGLACDGDADRFGIIDSQGNWIAPNTVLGLLLEHLVKNRGLKGKVARSVMTSHFVDSIAKYHGLETRETPVGFKYIGNLLRTGQYLIGGEESGGLSIQNHVPEKDGVLACLLMAEMVAYEKKPISKILAAINKNVGTFYNTRLNFHLSGKIDITSIVDRLSNKPPLTVANASVWRIDHTDGFKFVMKDGSWLGLRPSGTEPVVRIYAEAKDQKRLKEIVDSGKNIINGKF